MIYTNNYKKYANEILDDIETYKMVLDGRLKQFPNGFWTKPWSEESAKNITKYLIEERLKLKIEDIPKVMNREFFKDNKLYGMLQVVYDKYQFNVLEHVYTNKFKPWELRVTPNGFWGDKENIRMAMVWLIEEKLKWNDEQIKKYYSVEILQSYGLGALIRVKGLYELINIAYPDRFKPWELNKLNKNYWDNKNNVIYAIKWLIEKKLRLSTREDILKHYTVENITNNGLRSVIIRYSLFQSIDIAYPGVFKPEEFNRHRNR